VAQMPMIAPIADKMMQAAGFQNQPGGQDPNFPVPEQAAAMNIASPYVQGEGAVTVGGDAGIEAPTNTSPQFPARAGTGQQGIETTTPADNLGAPV